MLHEFLLKNEQEILDMAEKKTLALAGVRPRSEQLKKGLPIFYKQLLHVLLLNRGHSPSSKTDQESSREVEHLGFLAHELRNAIGTVKMAIELIKDGTVGFGGSTGQVLDRGLNRIEELIDRSLTEVRLRVDPSVRQESISLIQIINQLMVTAEIEAQSKNQTLELSIDPNLVAEADQQLVYSAVSNLIQNALKYTHVGGKIQIRGAFAGENIVIEVEDECGGLSDRASELFKPFEQQHEDRKGLGLGLTIAQKAINLNNGTLDVRNLPGKGCVFTITLPKKFSE